LRRAASPAVELANHAGARRPATSVRRRQT
jgi:hypothetical protein